MMMQVEEENNSLQDQKDQVYKKQKWRIYSENKIPQFNS